jgi:hypothetical protein
MEERESNQPTAVAPGPSPAPPAQAPGQVLSRPGYPTQPGSPPLPGLAPPPPAGAQAGWVQQPPAGWGQQVQPPPGYPPQPGFAPSPPAGPQAGWAQQPQGGWGQPAQPQPGYLVSQYPTAGGIQQVAGHYMQRGYRQTPSLGPAVTLERSPEFHLTLAFLLLFLFGIGALVYLAVYAVQRQGNTHRVQLYLRPDGQVEEVGYTLHELERDNLVLARRWRLFWTVVLWLAAGFFVIGGVGNFVAPLKPGTGQDSPFGTLVVSVGIAVAAFAGGWYLLQRAGRIGQELKTRYAR